ncbi:MAG: DUF3006 domain-containing protein [Bacillota bacterium]
MLIIDRFEGDVAVVEGDDRRMVHIDRRLLPAEAREGDVIVPAGDGRYMVDDAATRRRRAEMEELTRDLWSPGK